MISARLIFFLDSLQFFYHLVSCRKYRCEYIYRNAKLSLWRFIWSFKLLYRMRAFESNTSGAFDICSSTWWWNPSRNWRCSLCRKGMWGSLVLWWSFLSNFQFLINYIITLILIIRVRFCTKPALTNDLVFRILIWHNFLSFKRCFSSRLMVHFLI